ncbi:MAG: putative metal-binding motif-containing protein [Sandaracinaceae bacterium]|nr:putative metal-binding motif-containing protein [Sandaracinaceae bacterium]
MQPPDDRVRCAVTGGVDPCPAGQRCLDGVCTTLPDGGTECMPQETGCNDRDDDCDGTVDEGSDMDGDGFHWCDPEPALRDCRDDDPSIHPGRPGGPAAPVDLPCDGADNDCSGAATECPAGQVCHPEGSCRAPDCSFAIVCPAMQRCNTDLVPPSCEAVAVDCTVSGCASAPGSVCDPVSRMCIPPRMVGETCSFDAQCGADLRCFETAALGLRASDVGGAAQVCSRACCTSGDCPTGSTCWASGSGARGCVPTSILAAGPSGAPADEGLRAHQPVRRRDVRRAHLSGLRRRGAARLHLRISGRLLHDGLRLLERLRERALRPLLRRPRLLLRVPLRLGLRRDRGLQRRGVLRVRARGLGRGAGLRAARRLRRRPPGRLLLGRGRLPRARVPPGRGPLLLRRHLLHRRGLRLAVVRVPPAQVRRVLGDALPGAVTRGPGDGRAWYAAPPSTHADLSDMPRRLSGSRKVDVPEGRRAAARRRRVRIAR